MNSYQESLLQSRRDRHAEALLKIKENSDLLDELYYERNVSKAVMMVLYAIEYGVTMTEMDGEPFMIVDDWETIGIINDAVNLLVAPEAHDKWWEVYYAAAVIRDETPFHDLRLGTLDRDDYLDEWRVNYSISSEARRKYDAWKVLSDADKALPFSSHAPYQVPSGLIDFDDYIRWGFGDEYSTCSECYGAIRTSPDSYGWQPDYIILDCGYICSECVTEDELEMYINNHKEACPPIFDLDGMGWVEVDKDFENGLHSGQNDTPELVSEALGDIDHLFTAQPSQFTVDFSVWVRADDLDTAVERLKGYKRPLYGPSDALKAALRGAS